MGRDIIPHAGTYCEVLAADLLADEVLPPKEGEVDGTVTHLQAEATTKRVVRGQACWYTQLQ